MVAVPTCTETVVVGPGDVVAGSVVEVEGTVVVVDVVVVVVGGGRASEEFVSGWEVRHGSLRRLGHAGRSVGIADPSG